MKLRKDSRSLAYTGVRMFLKLQRETQKKEDNMNLRKKRIMVVIVMAIVLSSVQNTRMDNCKAKNLIELSEAENIIDDLNNEIRENQEEMIKEYVENENFDNREIEYINKEIEDDNVGEVIDYIDENCEDKEAVDELVVSDLDDLEKQSFVNPETDEEFKTVEEVEQYIETKGYNNNENDYNIYEVVEKIKGEDDCELDELIVKVDKRVSGEDGENNWIFGQTVKASSLYKETKKQWNALTTKEKVLIALEPKKALMTKELADLAYSMTNKEFGYNGLGDKSDGFRHGTWNALLTRDISRAWAELYTTAHESGKSNEQLERRAADNFKEKDHRKMDLHNNAEGRDVIKWYDTILNVSNSDLKRRVKRKLTNKKSDIYWLHD